LKIRAVVPPGPKIHIALLKPLKKGAARVRGELFEVYFAESSADDALYVPGNSGSVSCAKADDMVRRVRRRVGSENFISEALV
jgi:hypothetical protein